ncbi:arylsulfatase A-like enzyme [Povalibacter uvarum]|uniref:Arylsulfatase A-like enzyme n=1 Tax=Povalibacter uvarum TaxID=732238 RepID=A0A841HTW0_9GAMM|nr:sulfatase-like hydrolase/transferase [Povalibacter uvarum]MBB6096233.1 arylsulfatase A-like enzyme [Povalibacter uvarum]
MSSLTRRDFVVGAAALGASPSMAASVRQPNIVFILADDLGAGDLSCYGRPDYVTPNIDRLAAQGVRLTQSYANSCTCSPTRVALATGRYQNRLAVGNYDPLPRGVDVGLPVDHPTLASLLKRAGYETALIGKWHLGSIPKYSPLQRGYDEFFGISGGGADYFTHASAVLGPPVHDLFENDAPTRVEGYATDLFSARAVQFIKRRRSKPFFLSLHHTAPHWPWQTRDDRGGARVNDFHYDGGSPLIFAQMIAALDDGVGQVMKALRSAGVERDTIVIFTSDNGGERFSYNWPLRGEKFDLLEGGIRTPGIVRWPARIPKHSTSNQLVMSMDWLPTLLAAGSGVVDAVYPSDGIDVIPMLAKERAVQERTVFWRTQWAHAARRGSWKYYAHADLEYLYDLAADESESANQRLKQPRIAAELREAYEAWNAAMQPIPPDAITPREAFERAKGMEPFVPRGPSTQGAAPRSPANDGR